MFYAGGVIASLNGTVRTLGLDFLVLEVAGIGYHVRTSPPTLAAIRHDQQILLHTELAVREDSLTLYGFLTQAEADLFRTVQAVSGIGPRIALAVLTVMDPGRFAHAIMSEDIKTLTSIPGIGPKGAKRMALELKDRMAQFAAAVDSPGEAVETAPEGSADGIEALNAHGPDVVNALVGLGWPEKSAQTAVQSVLRQQEDAGAGSASTIDAANLLRLALRQLGGRQ